MPVVRARRSPVTVRALNSVDGSYLLEWTPCSQSTRAPCFFCRGAICLELVKAKFHYAVQLANQLASWFATCERAASELDNVMEFGLSGAIQLASRSQTSSRAGRRPSANRSATRFEISSNLSATGRKPGLRPAGKLVCDLLATCYPAASELDSA